jgi:hypothetical protein
MATVHRGGAANETPLASKVAPSDVVRVKGRRGRMISSAAVVRRSQFEGAVRTLLVEVASVDAKDLLELAAAEDEQPIEALPAHTADPALRIRVGVRRPDRRPDDANAFALEDAVEGAAELRVAVVDQEARALAAVVEIHQQVPRLLGHPGRIRVARAGDVLDPARPDRDEEEHVEPPQPDGIDGEKVAGDDRAAVLAQGRPPAEPRTHRRWRDAGAREHVAHQRRRDRDLELAQLARNPDVAPLLVLAREPQDQLAHLAVERRPGRPPARVRSAPSDDPPVQAQQRLRRHQERVP